MGIASLSATSQSYLYNIQRDKDSTEIHYRVDQLDLTSSMDGLPLRPPGHTILEIKVQEAMTLWLTHILDEGQIYKNSFSKYGEAFRQQLLSARAAG